MKKYYVDYGNINHGSQKYFWFYKNALKFSLSLNDQFVYIRLSLNNKIIKKIRYINKWFTDGTYNQVYIRGKR